MMVLIIFFHYVGFIIKRKLWTWFIQWNFCELLLYMIHYNISIFKSYNIIFLFSLKMLALFQNICWDFLYLPFLYQFLYFQNLPLSYEIPRRCIQNMDRIPRDIFKFKFPAHETKLREISRWQKPRVFPYIYNYI